VSGDRFVQHEIIINVGCDASAAYVARGNIVGEFVLFGWVAKARRQNTVRVWAEIVRVHEIEIDKQLGDVPLNSLCVDPWLCDERLGEL
jgi:hypothetical protein